MDYTMLTDAQRHQIALRKLHELEAEHAGMELDIRLARSSGIDNEKTAQAQQQLALLVHQIHLLHSWTFPPSEGEDTVPKGELVSPNGQEAVEVE